MKAKGCKWCVFIVYRDLKRGGRNKTWVLGLGKQEHSHEVSSNSLDCEIHQTATARVREGVVTS